MKEMIAVMNENASFCKGDVIILGYTLVLD